MKTSSLFLWGITALILADIVSATLYQEGTVWYPTSSPANYTLSKNLTLTQGINVSDGSFIGEGLNFTLWNPTTTGGTLNMSDFNTQFLNFTDYDAGNITVCNLAPNTYDIWLGNSSDASSYTMIFNEVSPTGSCITWNWSTITKSTVNVSSGETTTTTASTSTTVTSTTGTTTTTTFPAIFYGDWLTPIAVSSYSSVHPTSNVIYTIDGNWTRSGATGETWIENIEPWDVDGPIGDWYITFEFDDTYYFTNISIGTDTVGVWIYSPAEVYVIKVCDDAACDTEPNILTEWWNFTHGVQRSDYPVPSPGEAHGKYIYLEGGILNLSHEHIRKSGSDRMRAFREFAAMAATTTSSVTTTSTQSTTTTVGGTVTIIDETQRSLLGDILNWIRQLVQIQEDQFEYTNSGGDYCQLVISNGTEFNQLYINKRSYITEYTLNQYLIENDYYWRVRCVRNDRWSPWSSVRMFNHTNSTTGVPIYMDWTVD